MELAHLVYRVSTDEEYAAQFRSDPESTVEKLGLTLNRDEMASLLSVLRGPSRLDVLSGGDRGSLRAGWT